jgi:hypothetical protein
LAGKRRRGFQKSGAERRNIEEANMVKNIDDMQKLGKDNLDATMQSFGACSKTAQAIAVEMAEYSKKSFEDGTKALERLFGVKTLESAITIHSDYAKTCLYRKLDSAIFVVKATENRM